MSTVIHVWKCDRCVTEGYSRSAAGVGDPTGLRAIGWTVDANEHGEILILCPSCHPDGIEGAIAQALTLTCNWSASLTPPEPEPAPEPARKAPRLTPWERYYKNHKIVSDKLRADNAQLDALEQRLGVDLPRLNPPRKTRPRKRK